jgi:hypothetical protein
MVAARLFTESPRRVLLGNRASYVENSREPGLLQGM